MKPRLPEIIFDTLGFVWKLRWHSWISIETFDWCTDSWSTLTERDYNFPFIKENEKAHFDRKIERKNRYWMEKTPYIAILQFHSKVNKFAMKKKIKSKGPNLDRKSFLESCREETFVLFLKQRDKIFWQKILI